MDEKNEHIENIEVETSVRGELWREALSWIKTIVFALVFAWFFTNFIIINAIVPTGSMYGTIRERDRIVAFRLSYLFSDPSRYDIVVFRPGPDSDLWVKRVIALPGETVSIIDWRVHINGSDEPLAEDFVHSEFNHLSRHRHFPVAEFYPFNDYITVPEDGSPPYVTVPEGHFFVLGDFRDNSSDSRGMGNPGTLDTFVSTEQILGRVLFRYFPGFARLTV